MLTGDWREIRPLLAEYTQVADCPNVSWLNVNTLEFGMAQEVLDLSERVVACDPQNPFGWWYAMQAHMWLGNDETAVEVGERAVEAVDHRTLRQALVHAYVAAGRLDDAEYALKQEDGSPDELADRYMTVAAARGDAEEVEVQKERMIRHHGERIDVILNYLPRSGDREAS
ncbi:MAG: hypothetical protein P8X98_00990, partial [Woeseiaceae bacterium]